MKVSCYAWLLVAMIGMVGCNNSADPVAVPSKDSLREHDHDHGKGERDHSEQGHTHGAGPHGGTLADWGGGKYHLEFMVDHDKQEATVYVLGADEKTPMPIGSDSVELSLHDPLIQVTLTPSPQVGDPQGKASRFMGKHEKLGVVREFAGTITAVIEGTPYSGDFQEEAHEPK